MEVPDTWSADHLAEMQKADPEIGIIYRWLEEGKVPSRDDVLRHGAGVKGYAAQWKSLVLIHNVIYRLFEHPAGGTKFYQLLTPRALREELLQLVHAGAASHLGVRKTLEHLQRRAYWFTWRTDTETFCRRCEVCNQYARGKPPRQGTMQNMVVGNPMERIHLDLTGRHPCVGGFTYICTALCAFTKYAVAWPIRDKKATTVAKGLMEKVILPFGAPSLLLTDNGKEFNNELCQELCRLMGIERQNTTPYYPQCNGNVERWHSTMHSLLAKTVASHQRDWPYRLPYVTAAYNSSVHEAHGFTPNFLTFGRHLSAPIDVVLGNPSPQPLSPNDYADHLVGLLSDAYEDARAHLGRSAERNKRYYDYRSRPVTYKVGDRVWVYSPRRYKGRNRKWQLCYSGPYEVLRCVNPVNYVVRKGPRAQPFTVHVDKLKGYNPPGLGGAQPDNGV